MTTLEELKELPELNLTIVETHAEYQQMIQSAATNLFNTILLHKMGEEVDLNDIAATTMATIQSDVRKVVIKLSS